MDFRTAEQLLEICKAEQRPISYIMLMRESEISGDKAEAFDISMRKALGIMKDAVAIALSNPPRSMGGLIGGEAQKLNHRICSGEALDKGLSARAAAYAMGVIEINSSMGLIVAAPTAGASGVLPGVLLAMQEEYGLEDEMIVKALWNAAAIGYLFMRNSTVSGAQGGCQAEVGSAAAMAASATVELMGGTPEMSFAAAAMAISNLLGLVCDPVAGLVEIPCQKRNAVGAVNAISCAEIALAGCSDPIPLDEMIEAARRVGAALPAELRETALGGSAATPTACRLCKG